MSLYYEMLQPTPHPNPLSMRGEGKMGDNPDSTPLPSSLGKGGLRGVVGKSVTVSPFSMGGEGNKEVATKSEELSGKEWGKAYTDLFAEIKVRHYSPKTLRAYTIWVRKFQAFTKFKGKT